MTVVEPLEAPRKDEAARPARPARHNVVAEIAKRRRADIREEMARLSVDDHVAIAAGAPPARPILDRLASPGLHVIAEIKRSSPSAGQIAATDDDIVARARAYEAGGAAAISVLCEPHWFGGSVDDLRAVRAAVGIPVLAKEFVVEPIQLPHLRAAGADLVLLLAVLHPARRLGQLVDQALEIGLEPLVEAHDERELERALGTNARLVGLNNRDLRTLDVDTERAVRLRVLVPDDRLVVAESGVRDAATVAGWRAAGFDAALVGDALVRSADPRAAVAAFVSAGREPADPANAAARPFVKICGVTDAEGVLAAIRVGADAIGLNLVPGTPRALSLEEAVELRRVARALAPGDRVPEIVAITVDASEDDLTRIAAALDPDAVQLSGDESPERIERIGRPVWKALHLPAADPDDVAAAAASVTALGRDHLQAGAARLLLDTAGGQHPGGTGTRAAAALVAAVARELPVLLAGGLTPATVAEAAR
ncbi:MAG: bifunctional indole-3-glycerol phosphate synthase/phosphoribosylanthranilate isomerase, partial [Chloroflexota bacterium]